MTGRTLFIVNPTSGTGKQEVFKKVLSDSFCDIWPDYDIKYTECRNHAYEISKEACGNYDLVVAVGGDGTANEVARGLINSSCIMGIVPLGSGNGLARHLKIPMHIKSALKIICEKNIQTIDTAMLNDYQFVNVAGVGFDAHIAHLFAKTEKRGPIPYAKIATQEFQKYKSKEYEVIVEGQKYKSKAFLISFANSAQFGNNAYISPHAVINDGLIDVCLMSSFPKVEAGQLAIKLFNKRMDKSRYMKIIRGTEIKVLSSEAMEGHIDGEPVLLPETFEVKVNPGSLKVIYNANISKIDLLSNKIKNL